MLNSEHRILYSQRPILRSVTTVNIYATILFIQDTKSQFIKKIQTSRSDHLIERNSLLRYILISIT